MQLIEKFKKKTYKIYQFIHFSYVITPISCAFGVRDSEKQKYNVTRADISRYKNIKKKS